MLKAQKSLAEEERLTLTVFEKKERKPTSWKLVHIANNALTAETSSFLEDRTMFLENRTT